jgi:hypothetical protein
MSHTYWEDDTPLPPFPPIPWDTLRRWLLMAIPWALVGLSGLVTWWMAYQASKGIGRLLGMVA